MRWAAAAGPTAKAPAGRRDETVRRRGPIRQEEEEGRNNLFLIIVRKEFIGPTTRNTDSTKAVTELDITIFYYCVLVLKQSDIFFTN